MRKKRILTLLLAAVMLFAVTGCVNQHPEGTAGSANTAKESGEVRLVATSPAVAQICNRLNLDPGGHLRVQQRPAGTVRRRDHGGHGDEPGLGDHQIPRSGLYPVPSSLQNDLAAQIRFHRGEIPVSGS